MVWFPFLWSSWSYDIADVGSIFMVIMTFSYCCVLLCLCSPQSSVLHSCHIYVDWFSLWFFFSKWNHLYWVCVPHHIVSDSIFYCFFRWRDILWMAWWWNMRALLHIGCHLYKLQFIWLFFYLNFLYLHLVCWGGQLTPPWLCDRKMLSNYLLTICSHWWSWAALLFIYHGLCFYLLF